MFSVITPYGTIFLQTYKDIIYLHFGVHFLKFKYNWGTKITTMVILQDSLLSNDSDMIE